MAARSLHNSTTLSTDAVSGRAEGCDGFKLNGPDTDAANRDLQSACGNEYYGTVWSKFGSTVAFYC